MQFSTIRPTKIIRGVGQVAAVAERAFVLLHVCYTRGGAAAKCSDWQQATAGRPSSVRPPGP